MATAIGFRAHTGWAAAVALAGPVASPRVIDRRRIELTSATGHDQLYVYHTAAERPLARAKPLIAAARKLAHATAKASVAAWIASLDPPPSCAGIVVGNSQLPAALDSILASHALIHSAEGELYRGAIIAACAPLMITSFASNTLYERGAKLLAITDAKLRERLGELGRGLGAPWAKDHKESALVAWMALATCRRPFR